MSAHTPGPKHKCSFCGFDYTDDLGVCPLHLAAPALREALEAIMPALIECIQSGMIELHHRDIERARAAIAQLLQGRSAGHAEDQAKSKPIYCGIDGQNETRGQEALLDSVWVPVCDYCARDHRNYGGETRHQEGK